MTNKEKLHLAAEICIIVLFLILFIFKSTGG
jgi:hypothetical protein